VTRPPLLCVFTTTLLTSGPSRASSSTCTSPGFTSSTPSSLGKQWELARSVRERWPDPRNPVRANLDFFIGLRNKVEHRFARDHAALAAAVSGQAQAMLLNYEKELTDQFGIVSSLATRLRFPVFIGSFTGEGEKALIQLRKRLPASLRKFLAEYHTKLGSAVTDDPRYELRLRVL
jgi:hypothetical protein